MPEKYAVNEGNRDHHVSAGLERGIFRFVVDYARQMGMTKSGAVRRLILIGAFCEAEHGNASLPASYSDIAGMYEPSKKTKRKDMWN